MECGARRLAAQTEDGQAVTTLPPDTPPALHFVGFRDDRVYHARAVFGEPDFYHRNWDVRARQEIVPGDVAVFATGTIDDPVKPTSWDDSDANIRACATKEELK